MGLTLTPIDSSVSGMLTEAGRALLVQRTQDAELTRMKALLRRELDRPRRRFQWTLELPTMEQWRRLRQTKIPVGMGTDRWV